MSSTTKSKSEAKRVAAQTSDKDVVDPSVEDIEVVAASDDLPEPEKVMVEGPDGELRQLVRDLGIYHIIAAPSIVPEMEGRLVYQIVNKDTNVIEEETSMLVAALLHATQFEAEVSTDRWKARLDRDKGRRVMVPDQMVVPGGKPN